MFRPLLPKISIYRRDWILACVSTQFWEYYNKGIYNIFTTSVFPACKGGAKLNFTVGPPLYVPLFGMVLSTWTRTWNPGFKLPKIAILDSIYNLENISHMWTSKQKRCLLIEARFNQCTIAFNSSFWRYLSQVSEK